VKLSVNVTNYSWADTEHTLATQLRQVAHRCDDAGVDTLWVADHLLQMDPTATIDEPMLEAYTTLGYLAACTSHLRLGTMVTWASIRPPALLIKAVTTLDVLSGGRSWLGIGAGYNGDEAAMMGLPFEPTRERFERMEETIQLAAHMWTEDQTPFTRKHLHLEQPIGKPVPITRPKLLIGGMGEKRTLPLVARYGDACNLFDIPDGGNTLRHKLEVLTDACDTVGRDPADIEITISSRLNPGETTDQFSERCAALHDLGVNHVVMVTTGPWRNPELDVVLAAIDPVAAIGP
jgi:F420-dependent oxidoreductase-like protein